MIDTWLSLPILELVSILIALYVFIATALVWISYGSLTRNYIQSFKGITASFSSSVIPLLGFMIGFLASNVWDSNRKATEVVRIEAASLTSLYGIVAVSDLPYEEISSAIRDYVSIVVLKEWEMMKYGEAAPEAEIAQDRLLQIATSLQSSKESGSSLNRLLLDFALKISDARAQRLKMSAHSTENLKWISVLFLTFVGQVSIAAVHLDRPRPQMGALTIFTSAVVVVIALIATYDLPFTPPLTVSPAPIARVLSIVPDG